MRRDQLEHAIRASCQIIGHPAVIIVGSQAILGTYQEKQLPPAATMSQEVDVLPIAQTKQQTQELADLLVGVAGEWSTFEQQHGFAIDGVDLDTAILPVGWRQRLVKVQNSNTAAASGHPLYIGWCVDKEDLCVAKLCAGRNKDKSFVRALIEEHLVDRDLIATRLGEVERKHAAAVSQAAAWLSAYSSENDAQ